MIVIVDLDYTLLNSDQTLSKKTENYFKVLKEKGHKIVVNSARSYLRSKEIAEKIDADYVNCFYGNLLLDEKENILLSRGVGKENLENLIEDFKQVYNGWIGIETVNGAVGTNKEICKKMGAEVVEKNELLNHEAFKIIFEIDPNNPNKEKAEEIANKYNLDVKFAREGFFCSYLPKNTNKWNGLKVALEILGKGYGKSVAFGDEKTDLLTFENVDVPVAMKNSTQEVLEKIKNVTDFTNDEDGVARWIEKNEHILK